MKFSASLAVALMPAPALAAQAPVQPAPGCKFSKTIYLPED
jgi:hypothetical protein